ncbi:hypothetical protein LCGC14_1337690 [marine sediment metagenome]|uniref:Uncharacterized protein n=1 Tax=marine sediment metagenome TaxID=412755 RepID=A0A0F9L0X9_9ZZZZ
MTQQTRRQFFKTLAAIAIAGTVAVVTPAVVRDKQYRVGYDVAIGPSGTACFYFQGRDGSLIMGVPSKCVTIGRRSGYIVTPYENQNPKTR